MAQFAGVDIQARDVIPQILLVDVVDLAPLGFLAKNCPSDTPIGGRPKPIADFGAGLLYCPLPLFLVRFSVNQQLSGDTLPESPLNRPASTGDLYRLAEAKILDPSTLDRALAGMGIFPDRTSWKNFFDRLFLFLGSALTLFGVIYFFAFNWDKLGRFSGFGLIESGILATVVLAWIKGLDRLTGQVSLFCAAVLVGPLLAVYGQAYQTGADAHSLFLTWIVLIAGWAAVASFAPLWILLITLGNVWVILYWNQIFEERVEVGGTVLLLVVALMDAVFLLLWEEISRRGVEWMGPGWYPGIIAAGAVFFLSIFGMSSVVDRLIVGWVYIPIMGVFLAYNFLRTRDMFALAISMLSIILTVTALLIQILGHREAGPYLIIGLIVVGMTAGAVVVFRRIRQVWDAA